MAFVCPILIQRQSTRNSGTRFRVTPIGPVLSRDTQHGAFAQSNLNLQNRLFPHLHSKLANNVQRSTSLMRILHVESDNADKDHSK